MQLLFVNEKHNHKTKTDSIYTLTSYIKNSILLPLIVRTIFIMNLLALHAYYQGLRETDMNTACYHCLFTVTCTVITETWLKISTNLFLLMITAANFTQVAYLGF